MDFLCIPYYIYACVRLCVYALARAHDKIMV